MKTSIGELYIQYNTFASPSPCDIIKKMADFLDEVNRKLHVFVYLHIGVQTLSITICIHSLYCFIY